MRRIEAARVTHHAGKAGFLGLGQHRQTIRPVVRQRDLDLYVLARVHAGNRLGSMHLRWRTQDHGIDVIAHKGILKSG